MTRRGPEATQEQAINPGNVIPFVRPYDGASSPLQIGAEDRPAPDFLPSRHSFGWWEMFWAASFLAHAAGVAMFVQSRAPDASTGLAAISVEIVFGADAPAGVAPSQPEPDAVTEPPPAKEEPKAEQPPEPEPQPVVTPAPRPLPDPDALPQENVKEKAPKDQTQQPQRAASSIGRGQSRNEKNYDGLVAKHLAHYKRTPAVARGKRIHGTVEVSFSFDGSGRLTYVTVVRSSGVAALDQEAQSMVRRASPYPAPLSGVTKTYTVPVTFETR